MSVSTARKKSQISLEFVVLIAMAFVMLIAFSTIVSDRTISVNKERDALLLKEIVEKVKSEVFLASSVEDGYSRQFTIPQKLDGKNYNITIQNRTIIGRLKELEITTSVIQITGNAVKGINNITKTNGVICLNTDCS